MLGNLLVTYHFGYGGLKEKMGDRGRWHFLSGDWSLELNPFDGILLIEAFPSHAGWDWADWGKPVPRSRPAWSWCWQLAELWNISHKINEIFHPLTVTIVGGEQTFEIVLTQSGPCCLKIRPQQHWWPRSLDSWAECFRLGDKRNKSWAFIEKCCVKYFIPLLTDYV